MADTKFSRFMRPDMKDATKVFDVKIKDKDGNEMPLKMRRLSDDEKNEIQKFYRKLKPAYDDNGRPIIQKGRLVMIDESDDSTGGKHLLAEALVEPNLADKDLMEYYGEHDKIKMLTRVFTGAELSQISDIFQKIDSYQSLEDVTEEDVTEAKN